MRKPITKAIATFFIAAAAIIGYYYVQDYRGAEWSYFALAWPSLFLALRGIEHTWVLTVFILICGTGWLAFWSRKQTWPSLVFVTAFFHISYCVASKKFMESFTVPLPAATPYDQEKPSVKETYLFAYEPAFREGLLGRLQTHCFMPPAYTSGAYTGQLHGNLVWYRMLGKEIPEWRMRLMKAWARTDGVEMTGTE